MKALRALILVLALSVYAYADGNMGNGVNTPPPPTPPTNATPAPAGDNPAEQTETGVAETDVFTETALTLLQSMLGLI